MAKKTQDNLHWKRMTNKLLLSFSDEDVLFYKTPGDMGDMYTTWIITKQGNCYFIDDRCEKNTTGRKIKLEDLADCEHAIVDFSLEYGSDPESLGIDPSSLPWKAYYFGFGHFLFVRQCAVPLFDESLQGLLDQIEPDQLRKSRLKPCALRPVDKYRCWEKAAAQTLRLLKAQSSKEA